MDKRTSMRAMLVQIFFSFGCKTELCHDFTVGWVILFIDHIIVASLDVWHSYFAHICCKYILSCVANSLLSLLTHFLGKIVLAQTLVVSKIGFFHVCHGTTPDCRGLASIYKYSGSSVQCTLAKKKPRIPFTLYN